MAILLQLLSRYWRSDAFATFFFLSNSKFLSVSFDLLVPTTVHHVHRDNWTHTLSMYYSADIEYFGEQHLPYAVLAIAVVYLCVITSCTLSVRLLPEIS